jgi:hypothetical protein
LDNALTLACGEFLGVLVTLGHCRDDVSVERFGRTGVEFDRLLVVDE